MINDYIQIFKILSHPTRLAILEILREGEHCVCHMEAVLQVRQAHISQHLMVLREAQIVADRREGWNIYYRVIRPEIFKIIDVAREVLGDTADQMTFSLHSRSDVCSCPRCRLQDPSKFTLS